MLSISFFGPKFQDFDGFSFLEIFILFSPKLFENLTKFEYILTKIKIKKRKFWPVYLLDGGGKIVNHGQFFYSQLYISYVP